MEFDLFNELGFFTKKSCENIKAMMEGKTFYQYHVGWSNEAGNCSLVVDAVCDKEDIELAKQHFLSMLTREAASFYQKANFLHRYCMARMSHPAALIGVQGVREANPKGDYYFFYQDSEKAHELFEEAHMTKMDDGTPMAYVSRRNFENILKPNAEKVGVELVILEP